VVSNSGASGHHELITKGIYHFARHPMYLSIFTLTFAQAFLLNNGIAGPIGIVGFYVL
jgi:protein-S-isoprenylcysteine O-methyltransferase Ste14